MTDSIKSWVEERRAIHTAATEGPWEHGVKPFRGDIGHNVSSPERVVMFGGFESASPTAEADSVAVVDAHNALPRALDALEAVLEVMDAGVRDGDSAEIIRRVALIEIEGAIND